MTTTNQFQLGSVSTGTLRTEDLLPVFVEIATNLGIRIMDGAGDHLLSHDPGHRDYVDIDDLIGYINNACPPFVYFGAHPGDGADFGFWLDRNVLWSTV